MSAGETAQLHDVDAPPLALHLRHGRLAETAENLRGRVHTGLGIISFAIVVSAASDLFFLRLQQPVVHLAQLAQLCIVVASRFALRRSAWKQVVGTTVLAASALYVAMAAAGVASHDALTTPLQLNALTVGTASLLPWGTLPQLVTVLVAAAAIVANIVLVHGGLDLTATYPTLVASAIACTASVYIANKLTRARLLTQETERQRNEAERALRAAHAELEQRVAQRTAELQVANQALEKEMTERRQLEETARQHQAQVAQATRLSSAGQMAVEMAHELNQPLGAIANYAQGCARHLQSNTASTAELIDTVEQIAAEALRAGGIIRRIASIARKTTTLPERLHLNDLVHDVARLMGTETQRFGVTLHLDLAPHLPMVQVERIQIEQVMVNLIRNGCEAMDGWPGARQLCITTQSDLAPPSDQSCPEAPRRGERAIEMTPAAGPQSDLAAPSDQPCPEAPRRGERSIEETRAAGSVVEVAVRDTGRGLAPEGVARIFEPFYTTKPNGLGLGLSISRSIVEAHGGDLQAISKVDGGTTFRFTLPAATLET